MAEETNSYIVYCLTNVVNGKRYVGITKNSLEDRWKSHVCNAIVRKRKFLISNAIRKYGTSDDVWLRSILSEGLSEEDAKNEERRQIAELNTCALEGGYGYNMTSGGDGCVLKGEFNPFYGRKHSEETISKMKLKLSEMLGGEKNPQFGMRGELSPCWGKKHSEETKKKISEANKGKIFSEATRQKMSISARNRRKKNAKTSTQ